MFEEQAPGREQAMHPGDVAAQLSPADVLVHPDARHLVVRTVVELTVIRDANLDPVLQPMLADARAGERRLGL